MTCRTANETDAAPIKLQLRSRSWKCIDAAVQVQQYQPARRPSKGVDPGNRLLTAVAAFVQMNGNAEQADLVRDGAVICVEADPGYAGSNPARLERPGASSRSLAHDVLELITRHEELSATQRVGGNSDTVIAGQLSMRPHDRVSTAPVSYLDSHHETHPVQPAHECRGSARFGMRPEGLAVIDAVQHMFDVPVWRQHQRGYATTRLEPFEELRSQRVQPGQPVRPGHGDHTTVRQVDRTFAIGDHPLLTHRVAVVPRHADIWAGLSHYSAHGRFSTPVHTFLPVRLPS